MIPPPPAPLSRAEVTDRRNGAQSSQAERTRVSHTRVQHAHPAPLQRLRNLLLHWECLVGVSKALHDLASRTRVRRGRGKRREASSPPPHSSGPFHPGRSLTLTACHANPHPGQLTINISSTPMPTRMKGKICCSCVKGTPMAMHSPYCRGWCGGQRWLKTTCRRLPFLTAAPVDSMTVSTPNPDKEIFDCPGPQPFPSMIAHSTPIL